MTDIRQPVPYAGGRPGPAKPASDLSCRSPQGPMSDEDRFREELREGHRLYNGRECVNWARANAIWPLGLRGSPAARSR